MRKGLITLILVGVTALCSLTACSLQQTCKASGCDETNIYMDGYCKYHYYLTTGEDALKDLINRW